MEKKIPDFLIEMSQQMHAQDNRITAHPIWQVRHKEYLATGEGIHEHHWEVIDSNDDPCVVYRSDQDEAEVLVDYLRQNYHSDYDEEYLDDIRHCIQYGCGLPIDLPTGVYVVYCQEVEKIVKTCLTEADANWFIQRKQHDYPPLYTYVESMTYCPQMIELREWILSLTMVEDNGTT